MSTVLFRPLCVFQFRVCPRSPLGLSGAFHPPIRREGFGRPGPRSSGVGLEPAWESLGSGRSKPLGQLRGRGGLSEERPPLPLSIIRSQRQSEQRDQPERRGRKQSQKKAHECLPIPAACRQAPSRTLRFRAKPPVRAGRLRPVLPYQHWAQGTMASFPLFLALSCSPFAPLLSAPRASGKKEGRENPGLLVVSKERFLGKKCQGYPGMTGSGGFRSGGMCRITPNCLSSLVQLRNQQRSPLRLPQR